MKLTLLVFYAVLLSSCLGDRDIVSDGPFEIIEIPEKAVGSEIPLTVLKAVMEVAPEDVKKKNERLSDWSGNFRALALEVYFVERKNSPMKGKNLRFIIKKGTGIVDLQHYMDPREPGLMAMGIRVMDDEIKPSSLFFYSESKKRKIKGESFGAGCFDFINLNKSKDRVLDGAGLQVSTAKAKHVSLLGGIFYVFSFKDGDIYLSRVRVKDSTYPEYICAN